MTHELINNVYDNRKDRKGERILICKAGEKIELIPHTGEIAICRTGKGETFATNIKNLKEVA